MTGVAVITLVGVRTRKSLRMWVYADVAQLVERELPKLEVAGSKPVVRLTASRLP